MHRRCQYFSTRKGGIVDDMMITKHASDAFYVVTNAARGKEDLAWFAARLAEWNASERSKDGPVEHDVLEDGGCLRCKVRRFPAQTEHITYQADVANARQVPRPRTAYRL